MSLGEKLKTLRTQRHLTLKTVATHAKISPGYLSQLETGKKRQPSAEILARLATELQTTTAILLNDTPPLPQGLKTLVCAKGERLGLREEDIQMLAAIQYRGKQPELVHEWEYLLQTIRLLVKDGPFMS